MKAVDSMKDGLVMSLKFAGALLPVVEGPGNLDVVPLKPITDSFGLSWRRQRAKILTTRDMWIAEQRTDVDSQWLSGRLGLCVANVPHGGQMRKMLCIRVDRVAAFLGTIDPNVVCAAGNGMGAALIANRLVEWNDVLQEYEMASGISRRRNKAARPDKIELSRLFVEVCEEMRLNEGGETRRALAHIAADLALDLGIPFDLQSEVLGRNLL